jgi:hypothetical protein
MVNWPITIRTSAGTNLKSSVSLKDIREFKMGMEAKRQDITGQKKEKPSALPIQTWLIKYVVEFATEYPGGSISNITIDFIKKPQW